MHDDHEPTRRTDTPSRNKSNRGLDALTWAKQNKILLIIAVVILVALLIWLVTSIANKSTVTKRPGNNPVVAQYERQLPELKRAVDRDGNSAEARRNYGVALYGTGDTEGAKEQYKKAVELNDKDSVAWNNLGNMHRELKETDEAISAYKKSIELNSKSLNPYINLGNIYLYMKDQPNEAVAIYRQGLKEMPENVQLESLLASAYESQGNKQEAKAVYERMLQRDKDSEVAKAGLERLK